MEEFWDLWDQHWAATFPALRFARNDLVERIVSEHEVAHIRSSIHHAASIELIYERCRRMAAGLVPDRGGFEEEGYYDATEIHDPPAQSATHRFIGPTQRYEDDT